MAPNTVESGCLGDCCRLAHELCGAAPVQQDTSSGFRKEGLEVYGLYWYGVATVSKINKIIGLFCRISFLL